MTKSFFAASNASRKRGMSLIEIVVALGVLAMLLAGILAVLTQTRRLTAASIAQNCALTIVQGYIEQLKNIPLQQFVNAAPGDPLVNPQLTTSFTLPTLKDQTNTTVQLVTTPSTVTASTMLNATPGTTPTGVYDNLQSFDMDSRVNAGTTTWSAAWPDANTTLVAYPSTTPGKSDLRMNFWVQITDLSPSSSAKSKAYGILIVYSWQYLDGSKVRYAKDAVRSVRSAVQTF